MKHLSNAELRILYLRQHFLAEFVKVTALQAQTNLRDSWERSLKRIQAVRAEIKVIVDDPQFDVLVSYPDVAMSGPHFVSTAGTVVNVVACSRELASYIEGMLRLHVNPKSEELREDARRTAKVFIGHGRNDMVRHKVTDFVRVRCRLEPLVLMDLPSEGQTIIEKLEKHGRTADYAVLILTGDDVVSGEQGTRARQNVIQELGWFQGVLGRQRTMILKQASVELASNIAGVLYLEFEDDKVEITFDRLRQELEAAGLLSQA